MQPYPKYNLDLARIADSVIREVHFKVHKSHTKHIVNPAQKNEAGTLAQASGRSTNTYVQWSA